MSLYYEAHVTIDPIFDARRDVAAEIATKFGFRLAKLIMRKREADAELPAQDDTFMTANSTDVTSIQSMTRRCVRELQAAGFVVRRYKIEDTILDSRHNDELGLLTKEGG